MQYLLTHFSINGEGYTCPLFVSQLILHVIHSVDHMQTEFQESKAQVLTQEPNLCLWCQNIIFH